MTNPVENDMAKHGSSYICSILNLYVKNNKSKFHPFFYDYCPVTQLLYLVFDNNTPDYLTKDGKERYKTMITLFSKYEKYKPAMLKERRFTLEEFYALITEDAIFCSKAEKEFKKVFSRELTLINILG